MELALDFGVGSRQLFECLAVYLALKVDDLTQWIPVADPGPIIEFWFFAAIEANVARAIGELKEKPFLLLADTKGMRMSTDIALRKAIPQPAAGLRQQFYLVLLEADFFI